VQGSNQNFYGTTYSTIYELGQSLQKPEYCYSPWCLDVLNSGGTYDLTSALVQSGGTFFGTAVGGGSTACGYGDGCGTVFRISSGKFAQLYSFCSQPNCADGYWPFAGLTLGTDGYFYGITSAGGVYGNGTIFRMGGGLGNLTTLHSLADSEGSGAEGRLIQATDGNFYGATPYGGANGSGTIFKVTRNGELTVLYNFCSQPNCVDGNGSYFGLVQGTDGNFYGTAHGGANGYGVIFEITPSGTPTILHNFDGTDGAEPNGLVQDTNGTFYGTTGAGGAYCGVGEDCGTVFSLSVGLGPFVKTQPTIGRVGAEVIILGSDFGGTTGVTFNGTAAVFTVDSGTEITATVPVGATTGTVAVTTPSGTLYSNVAFTVTPTCLSKCPTSITLLSSLNPSVYGQKVGWTATVNTVGSFLPTGKVNFTWDNYSIGTVTLNASGVATLTRSNLNADLYPLTAVYLGDANNARPDPNAARLLEMFAKADEILSERSLEKIGDTEKPRLAQVPSGLLS
jgi:uncharacterized repeat protein (TIGR03803 family)